MAELVDALDSKSSSGNGVWVRFPLWVQSEVECILKRNKTDTIKHI